MQGLLGFSLVVGLHLLIVPWMVHTEIVCMGN